MAMDGNIFAQPGCAPEDSDSDMESLFGSFIDDDGMNHHSIETCETQQQQQQQKQKQKQQAQKTSATLPEQPLDFWPLPLPVLPAEAKETPEDPRDPRGCDVDVSTLPVIQNQFADEDLLQAFPLPSLGLSADGSSMPTLPDFDLFSPEGQMEWALMQEFCSGGSQVAGGSSNAGQGGSLQWPQQLSQQPSQEEQPQLQQLQQLQQHHHHQQQPQQQSVDTFHDAVGQTAAPLARLSHDDQEGRGCVDAHDTEKNKGSNANENENDDNNDDDDDEVMFVSSRPREPAQGHQSLSSFPSSQGTAQVCPVSMPHYLELRPRCPDGPPPRHIHQYNGSMEELLPYVHLNARLPLRSIYQKLDVTDEAGKLITAECRYHLSNPEHTIVLSGSSDPAALRVLKVTLILSSLALLSREGIGERWFGVNATLRPKSRHVWPEDSTTLVLELIQLLYNITRSDKVRDRSRKKRAAARREGVVIPKPKENQPSALSTPQRPLPPSLSYNSPWCQKEALLSAQRQEPPTRATVEPMSPWSSQTSRTSLSPMPSSAPSPASTVLSTVPSTVATPETTLLGKF